jgi:uncharacterized protein GlcG (DUF336 family)
VLCRLFSEADLSSHCFCVLVNCLWFFLVASLFMLFLKSAYLFTFCALIASSASIPLLRAAELPTQKVLPASLAVQVAEAAIKACNAEGYGVTAVVVNTEGNVIVQIRGDGARVQTVETARNKAYSAVTLAANHNLDLTSGILGSMQSKGAVGIGSWPMPPAPILGITLFAGGINLRSQGTIVGALGVSGTPNGKIDEGCAIKARDSVRL